ncbi:hypothetical protein JYK00_03375 [Thermosipho ferrireducens]|uniref:DUF1570 domain-containing protein n=1 Tax=Thermosipho ferrireducens TaxID=2571116 RepID=A0ABX7SA24_9BACT|nr:hypothetical protein [Thermosipho ferrireducens]QTA38567.1 hypothetical protein JYK00_03375 [Thermosipho ferrireducens]
MKRVVATVEKGVNYIFHVLTVSGVNFQNDYTKKYVSTIDSEDLKFLKENREFLTFQNGAASELVDPLIFFPAYLNLDSKEKLEKYFKLLVRGLREDSKNDFLKEYEVHIEKRKYWFPEIDSIWFEKIKNKAKFIEKMGLIYVKNFSAYESLVWPDESKKLQEKAEIINRELEMLNLIERWENITKLNFKFDKYQIVLVSSIEGGPNANSLGYDRNVFYYATDLGWLIDFVSHEVGTHILIDFGLPIIKKFISNHEEPAQTEIKKFQEFYMAYECLAQFYNSIVLDKKLSYDLKQFNSNRYLKIYQELYDSGKNSAGDMLGAALKRFK